MFLSQNIQSEGLTKKNVPQKQKCSKSPLVTLTNIENMSYNNDFTN